MIRFPGLRTVTGAAHTNWSMFGTRGPCLAPEDGGGTGAAPASPPGGDPPAPAPQPNPPPTEVTFTPEQQAVVNKLVGQARVEGRNAARPQNPAPAPAPAPTPAAEPKLTVEDLARQLADAQMRARFDKRAAKRGLEDDAADDLFELYRVQKPTDDEQWFAERERRLGLKAATSPTTQTTSTQTTTTAPAVAIVPNTAPISDRGSPAPAGAVGWRHELQTAGAIGMSKTAREQMDAELGPEKGRAQRLAASREQASRMRVVFGPNQKG